MKLEFGSISVTHDTLQVQYQLSQKVCIACIACVLCIEDDHAESDSILLF